MNLLQLPVIRWAVVLILFLFFQSCSTYSLRLRTSYIKKFDLKFAEYCKIDTSSNFEQNAILANIYGDLRISIGFASKNEPISSPNPNQKSVKIKEIESKLRVIVDNPNSTIDEVSQAKRFLSMVDPLSPEKAFETAKMLDADSAILKLARKYHFILLNEAHYSAQNRAFTHSLLKPLWGAGYRYLALEALGYDASSLARRGTPNINTGYYLKDPVFSSMVRDAIKIGFKLIPYETRIPANGTARDREQAINIYDNTYKNDPSGKVIIHAGYSHISEEGDSSYLPMGAQLKILAKQDILTIDQISMIELSPGKQHPSYDYVKKNFVFNKPVVFVNNKEEIIVDPINQTSIDVQVYHPGTDFKYDRPTWLLFNPKSRYINIASDLKDYQGFLIQALIPGADPTEIPVDQIVIKDQKALILQPGDYLIRIINRQGDLVKEGALRIK